MARDEGRPLSASGVFDDSIVDCGRLGASGTGGGGGSDNRLEKNQTPGIWFGAYHTSSHRRILRPGLAGKPERKRSGERRMACIGLLSHTESHTFYYSQVSALRDWLHCQASLQPASLSGVHLSSRSQRAVGQLCSVRLFSYSSPTQFSLHPPLNCP